MKDLIILVLVIMSIVIFVSAAFLQTSDKYGAPGGLNNAADSAGYGVSIKSQSLHVGNSLNVVGATTLGGLLSASSLNSGTNSFTTTATADTIVISGVTASSIFVVSINDATPVANDLLSWTVKTDSLFVHRPAGTTSGLAYSYIRID